MTTRVTVHANHGWPVRVTQVNIPPSSSSDVIVKAGDSRDFYIHSNMDIHVHEIQPGEPDFTTHDT